MRTIAIIQARLGSTRCPRKVIREIRGKPLIRYVVERVRQAKLVDGVIVAVPVTDVEEITDAVGPGPWRVIGPNIPEEDVAERFKAVLMGNPCDSFVRICADSPLIDDVIIDTAVSNFKTMRGIKQGVAMMSNMGFPHGQQVEVLDTEDFLKYEPEIRGKDREHVTMWFYKSGRCPVGSFHNEHIDYSDVRMVVDTEEDFEDMKTLIGKMEKPHTEYHWCELMEMM